MSLPAPRLAAPRASSLPGGKDLMRGGSLRPVRQRRKTFPAARPVSEGFEVPVGRHGLGKAGSCAVGVRRIVRGVERKTGEVVSK